MGCCGSSDKADYAKLGEFPPLVEDFDTHIFVRDYPYEMMEKRSRQAPEDIKTYRLVLIGDKAVGKTQIIEALQKHSFLEEYEPTIEDEVMVMHKVPINDNTGLMTHDINDFYDCLLKIMDTAGMSDALHMNTGNEVSVTDTTKLREWIIKGHIFLIVFDLTNKESFLRIPSFFDEISRCKQIDNPPIVLVGNKADLVFDDLKGGTIGSGATDTPGGGTGGGTLGADDEETANDGMNAFDGIVMGTTPSDAGTLSIVSGYVDGNETKGMHGKTESTSMSSVQASDLTVLEYKNKEDLRDVSSNDIIEFCEQYDVPYVQCSAKSKFNIEAVFNVAIKESLLYQDFYGEDMRKWMRIKRTMSLQQQDGNYSLHN